MTKIKFLVLDFETTGLNYEIDYPIEIGGLFCDKDWNIVDTINTLIGWKELLVQDNWMKSQWRASTVHKISWGEYVSYNKPVEQVVDEILRKIVLSDSKPILVSDNAIFEFNFMRKLLKAVGKNFFDYFHYKVWDTNLLLCEATSIGDTILVHRAFEDATRLYKNIIRALEKTKC